MKKLENIIYLLCYRESPCVYAHAFTFSFDQIHLEKVLYHENRLSYFSVLHDYDHASHACDHGYDGCAHLSYAHGLSVEAFQWPIFSSITIPLQ